MAIEVPVLRLGLAGYSEAQQRIASAVAAAAGNGRARWELGAFAEADAWWLEGSRTLLQANQRLRVQPAVPSGRSVQLALSDVDRPVAFSLPIAAAGFQPAVTFELAERDAAVRVLHRFTDWLQVMVSQFALASSVVDQQPALASGSWEVVRGGDLLAVVDLELGTGVMPGATPGDFAAASWCIRSHGAVAIPSRYPRASVSQVMWQYAQRTGRDLLPPHYRSRPLFFRRPPRLPQRQLKDAHLLVVRELAASPGMNFDRLQHATGLGAEALSRVLAALYVVGSITSNPRRVVPSAIRRRGAGDAAGLGSVDPGAFPSAMDSVPHISVQPGPPISDKTAPLPLRRE